MTGPKFYGLDYTSTCADTYGLLALAIHMPKSNAKQNHVVFQNHRIISNTTTLYEYLFSGVDYDTDGVDEMGAPVTIVTSTGWNVHV